MRLKTLVAVLVAAIATVAVAAPAIARAPGSTKVTIRANGGVGFDGKVSSNKASKCAAGRKVTVFRVKNGKDEKIGSDQAQANDDGYEYFVLAEGETGRFYAKTGKVSGCDTDTSKTVEVRPVD